jgi:hypothetical protein
VIRGRAGRRVGDRILDGDGRIVTATLVLGSVWPTLIPVPADDVLGVPHGDAVVEKLAQRAAAHALPGSDARG